MAFGLTNFTFAVVSGSFTTGQTTLNISAGHGGRFSDFPAMGVLWNNTLDTNPAEAFHAGRAEIIEIGSKSGDILQTLKRGQESTSAIASIGTDEYRVQITMTRAQWVKTWRGTPDGSMPFDAVESGTGNSPPDVVARLIKTGLGTDKCFLSIQGGRTSGSGRSGVCFGDDTDGDISSLKFSRAAADFLSLACGTEYLRLVTGNGVMVGDPPTGTPNEILHLIQGADLQLDGFLSLPVSNTQTISSGVITVLGSCQKVDTESAASTDDLDTINGGADGKLLILLPANTARTVVLKHNTGNILLAGGSDFSLINTDNSILLYKLGSNWIEVSSRPATSYVHIRDEKSSGTDGGTFTTGAPRTRDLNTEVSDKSNLATLSSNQITLQPGDYIVSAWATAFQVSAVQLTLENITDTATTVVGDSGQIAGVGEAGLSVLNGRFQITAAKAFELQHECGTTKTGDGFGLSRGFGNTEVYSSVEFFRIGDA